MEKNALMDHGRTGGRFPTSRDWNLPTITCSVEDCVANRNKSCTCPSLIEIGPDGKCKGLRRRG